MAKPPSPPTTDELLQQLIAQVQALRVETKRSCVLLLAAMFEEGGNPQGLKGSQGWANVVALAQDLWNTTP